MGTTNDPRRVGIPGRGKNQLTINLEAIKDRAVREALENVVEFVRELSSGGLSVDGDISGRALQTDGGGSFRVKVVDGTVVARDTVDNIDLTYLTVPGVILGAFGYAQVDGTAEWQVMTQGVPASGLSHPYFYAVTGLNNDRKVGIRNLGSNPNRYRVVIFYSGDRA